MVMWLSKIFRQGEKHKKKLKTEGTLPYILEANLRRLIMLKEQEGRDIFLEVYKTKDRKSLQLCFNNEWSAMEKVDKVETLVSLEKEIAGIRREICNELFSLNKGRL
tara:strand:- start:8835 stop:9155 length:321 start_codon:yes stop_codon:yes gene_type:complete